MILRNQTIVQTFADISAYDWNRDIVIMPANYRTMLAVLVV